MSGGILRAVRERARREELERRAVAALRSGAPFAAVEGIVRRAKRARGKSTR